MLHSRLAPAPAVEGRELVVRAVPWDTPALVSDDGRTTYWEAFARGAFRRVARDPSRTAVTYLHSDDAAALVGHCVALDESDQGLIAHARLHDSPGGDQVLAAVREGYLQAVSIRFHAAPEDETRVTIQGRPVVLRTRVRRLSHIALVPEGAYVDAQVLAVRAKRALEDVERSDWIMRRMRFT